MIRWSSQNTENVTHLTPAVHTMFIFSVKIALKYKVKVRNEITILPKIYDLGVAQDKK